MPHLTVSRQQAQWLLRRGFLGAGLAFLLAACSPSTGSELPKSGADRPSDAPSGSNQMTAELEGEVIRLPIDKYSLNGMALETVEGAVKEVTSQCMKRLGHSYRQDDAAGDVPEEENRRYGIQDTSRAAAYGYRPYSVVNPPKPDSKARPYTPAEWASLSAMDDNGRKIAKGTKSVNGETIPEGGCRGEADRVVRAPFDHPEGVSAARTIYFKGFEKSLADPAVKAIFREWSVCMADKGYAYDSPLAAMGSVEFSRGRVTNRERAVAKADISCKKRVNLVPRWNAVESAIETRMIRDQSAVLNELLKRQNAKVAAARKILRD